MSTPRAYVTLLDIAKSHQGRIDLASPEVLAFLQITPKNPKGRAYRLASYIWDIRQHTQLTVVAERVGRTVTAYVIPAIAAVAPALPDVA